MDDEEIKKKYPWPRRRVIRSLWHTVSAMVFNALTKLKIEGKENLPRRGPLLVVANHFNFADPALLIGIVPWPIEMIGGAVMPNAPDQVKWIARSYGVIPVHRGTGRREALVAGESVLKAGGILGIFPEGQSNAPYLRRARPGAAFLAARAGCPILPMGIDGTPRILPRLRQRNRATVTVRVGKLFGPYDVEDEGGPEHRRRLDEIGDDIMRHIAALIPSEHHGVYSQDDSTREAARAGDTWNF
jgi:1-acyl-sn-glycerol-3-phosphate acyltransferase